LEDTFIIFRSDQRAIGEFMVTSRGIGSGETRPDCLGYSEFLEHFEVAESRCEAGGAPRPPVVAWAARFKHDLATTADAPRNVDRLVNVQRRLIDLVDLLDADRVRYPELNYRGKLPIVTTNPPERARSEVWFLWRHASPWDTIGPWALAHELQAGTDSLATRTYRGRRGVTLKRPEVKVVHEDGWVTIDARMARRSQSRAIDGSLRDVRGRTIVNALLRAFDRPLIADGSTLPARAWRWLVRRVRRLRRVDGDHES
jgi:hypothetical protein